MPIWCPPKLQSRRKPGPTGQQLRRWIGGSPLSPGLRNLMWRARPASVADVQRDRLVLGPDGEGGLLEGRLRQDCADAVRQRIALDRQADKVGIQVIVAVLVVIGADGIGAGRQVVEGNRNRPGARSHLPHRVVLVAVEEFARGRIKADKDVALGAVEPVDRDDDTRRGCRSRDYNQRQSEGKKQAATMHTGDASIKKRCMPTDCCMDAWLDSGSAEQMLGSRRTSTKDYLYLCGNARAARWQSSGIGNSSPCHRAIR